MSDSRRPSSLQRPRRSLRPRPGCERQGTRRRRGAGRTAPAGAAGSGIGRGPGRRTRRANGGRGRAPGDAGADRMILAVTGGKGGVGKSTVAFNLAAELDGVVVDADLGMADLPPPTDRTCTTCSRVAPGRCRGRPRIGCRRDPPLGRSLAGARAADPARLCDAVEAVERGFTGRWSSTARPACGPTRACRWSSPRPASS